MVLNRNTSLKQGSGFKSKESGFKSKGNGLKKTSSLKSASVLKSNSNLKETGINGKSKKQAAIDGSYTKNKKEKYLEDELCTGCEKTMRSTPSHLIPRSKREDLIDVIENLKPHCLDCHRKWESVERTTMLDYEENMTIVKRLDSEFYRLMIMKQERWLNNNQNK